MESLSFAIVACTLLLCLTFGVAKCSQYEHENSTKCMDMGYPTYPNGACDLSRGKMK